MKQTKKQYTSTERRMELQTKYVVTFIVCIVLTAFSMWGAVYSDEGYLLRSLYGMTAAVAFLQAIIQLSHADSETN